MPLHTLELRWFRVALPWLAAAVVLAVPQRPVEGLGASLVGASLSDTESLPTIDQLLGRLGRKQHADLLAKRFYQGNAYSWQQYSSWGRELLVNGFVEKPPTGKGPSAKLSEHYRLALGSGGPPVCWGQEKRLIPRRLLQRRVRRGCRSPNAVSRRCTGRHTAPD